MLLGLIGNPTNRRITLAQAAATEAGIPYKTFTWHDCPSWINQLDACDVLKIDAAGEDMTVTRQHIALGGGPKITELPAIEHGELAWLSESHRGFCHQLDVLDATGLHFINSPSAIKTMFNKWACHERFESAGIPRPSSFLAPNNVKDFLNLVQRKPAGRLFLKPIHGSSASGVLAFRWQGDHQQIIAPIEIQRRSRDSYKLFNSLKIRSFLRFGDIKTVLQHLLPHGMIAEQWLRKAQLNNRNVDVRIVTIAGKACHFVARHSRYPMTNLHLGSERASEQDFVDAFGAHTARACREVAEQAASCFPDALYSGVDVMITSQLQPVVLEINAFGDLLPYITCNGQSTYTAILEAATHHKSSGAGTHPCHENHVAGLI